MAGSYDLYNMDCMELMAKYDDNHFDLAIVDPPYGIGADKKHEQTKVQSRKSAALSKGYDHNNWDDAAPDTAYFDELFRVAQNVIVWGVNYFTDERLKGGRIYWDKEVTMPTYSDGELAFCSMINRVQSVKIAWHGMIQHDMKNKEVRIHPTQKPVALYNWLLNEYATEGQKILDTHLGSGSIAIACYYRNMHLTGSELDNTYYNRMMDRVERGTKQMELF